MVERFAFRLLEESIDSNWGNFVFTNGYCSKFSDEFIANAKEFYIDFVGKNDGIEYIIRAAKPEDEQYMQPILIDYGESETNYNDLEFFPRDKFDIIAKNMTHWAAHACFFTILMFEKGNPAPIGFLQTDPYNTKTIEYNLENFFLNRINTFLRQSINIDVIKSSNLAELEEFFYANILHKYIFDFFAKITSCDNIPEDFLQKWINFAISSFKTYKYFLHLVNNDDTALCQNMSYSLFQKNKRQGIMLKAIKEMISFLKTQKMCKALFTDRIAIQNFASISLVDKLSMSKTTLFNVFYNNNYFTRKHPYGLFMEKCTSCVKII